MPKPPPRSPPRWPWRCRHTPMSSLGYRCPWLMPCSC
jgi:hypothetical protein